MRSYSLAEARRTISNEFSKQVDSPLTTMASTIEVESKIKQKIRTFTQWNYRTAILRQKKTNEKKQSISQQVTDNTQGFFNSLLLTIATKAKQQQAKSKNKNKVKVQQLDGVKTERRERLKRVQNPMLIIQHYITKQKFTPTEEQNLLLQRIIKLKQKIQAIQPINLDIVLKNLYKTMNMAVDLNQTRFLILATMLAGQICLQCRQLNSSFFFFTQAMIAATCARYSTIKLQALIKMGQICIEALEYGNGVLFFKKALQYAWKIRDAETELKCYDWIGKCLYYEGSAQEALYYHNRYVMGELEGAESAVRKISAEMLNQYEKTLDNKQRQNLSSLFIEYLRLPITNFSVYPPTKANRSYENYINSVSPRKQRQCAPLDYRELPPVHSQIDQLLQQSAQFSTCIPNPDLRPNFAPSTKYSLKPQLQPAFEHSNQFHRILGRKAPKVDPSLLAKPVQERVRQLLEEKPNGRWWEQMVAACRKQRGEQLGGLRNKIEKMHLSAGKDVEGRRRAREGRSERVGWAVNRTLLDWIDPERMD